MNVLHAQTNADSALVGRWKGTSICQVKNSPCHDETVVYYISKGKGANEYDIVANKIVNGAEEGMGTLHFTFDEKKKEFNSHDYGTWNFKLVNQQLNGTLYSQGALYRIISLTKM